MAFSGLFIHSLLIELNQLLQGGRISKISEPFNDTVVFTVRSLGKNYSLLFSANPNSARIQITNQNLQNPITAPNFLMTLRRYLSNGKILSINQIGADRIVYLLIQNTNDFGDFVEYKLFLEIIGSKTNIILVDYKNKIIDVLKRGSIEDERALLPGLTYEEPVSNKINPFEIQKPIDINSLEGFNKKDVTYADKIGLDKFLKGFNNPKPTYDDAQKDYFAWDYVDGRIFSDFSSLLDQYYQVSQKNVDNSDSQRKELLKIVRNEIKKNNRKLSNLEHDLEKSKNADQFRIYGEILTTYLNQVPNNVDSISLPNFYDDMKEIAIPLDVKLTNNQNAQKYFKQYTKLKNSWNHILEQQEITNQNINYLSELEFQIENTSKNELEQIAQEMQKSGLIKTNKNKFSNKPLKAAPEKFLSSDGTLIEVGKNNLQNEQLSIKNSNRKDIWLHVKDIPGAHVIIRSQNPSQETILEAAKLAAFFSKAKNSSKVPVDYLPAGKLKKPSGSRPGFVTFTGQTTIIVDPEVENVERLRQNLREKVR
ncbi:MAG: NFACT family protein [Lactobacillaceae bacterium]|jgi:predicted ribosome quality control (RQC) complex YloA/Tae2 family protein|nr:NFACT family protein [Lactobacillaceae bacterium]